MSVLKSGINLVISLSQNVVDFSNQKVRVYSVDTILDDVFL